MIRQPAADPQSQPALNADWSFVLEAVSRPESPEAWWVSQDRSCLVIAISGDESAVSNSDLDVISQWLRRLPAPVIAVAPDFVNNPVLAACDVRTSSVAEANSIVLSVSRSPIAALSLVQVLRLTEGLSAENALQIESLAYATLQGGIEFQRWRKSCAVRPAPREEGPPVTVERDGDRLALCLNRSLSHNALNTAMRDALVEAFELINADSSIEIVTLRGDGRCYSVGGDVNEFGDRPDPSSAHRIRSLRNPAVGLLRCAQRVEFHLHNACIGSGIELPAFGRRIIARRDAYFQLPELHLGLIPGSGGCVSIPKRIGRQRTALLALGGRRISAPKALEWGLIDAIVD